MQNTYKALQADYTRKTQEIAPWRKLGDDITPESVQEALSIREQLQNPEIQRQLYDALNQHFGAEAEVDLTPDYSEFDDPRDAQLAQVMQRLDAFENRQLQSQVEAEIAQAERLIREENPGWNDDDMQTVAQLALGHGGDMLKGAESFKGLQQRLLKAHLDGKAQVPAGATGISPTGHAEVPTKFDSLEDAHKAALAAYRSQMDQ